MGLKNHRVQDADGSKEKQKGGNMKLALLLLGIVVLIGFVAPDSAYSLTRRPEKEEPNAQPIAVKPVSNPPPSTRDIQIATGDIKPVNPDESDQM